MKRETRNYIIRKLGYDEPESNQFYNMPYVIEYKGKYCILGMGESDYYNVFRYGKDFAVLSYNPRLGYAALMTIDPDMIKTGDIFIDNVYESIETRQDFFDYTENTMADYLAQWIY